MGTRGSCWLPNVRRWTYGKWVMSKKLSVILGADVCHTSTGGLIRRKAGSSSHRIAGISPAASPTHTHTSP